MEYVSIIADARTKKITIDSTNSTDIKDLVHKWLIKTLHTRVRDESEPNKGPRYIIRISKEDDGTFKTESGTGNNGVTDIILITLYQELKKDKSDLVIMNV